MKRTDSRCIRPVFLGFVSILGKEPVGGMPQGGFCRSAGKVQVPRLWDTCVAREPHLHGSRATLALHLFHTSVPQTGDKKGVSKLKVTDILLFLGTDYTEKHRERRIIIREIPCNPCLKESNSLI